MSEKTVTVPKIACGHCVATIEEALKGHDGVQSYSVDQASKRVTVEWAEPATDWDHIAKHLADVGYPPEGA
jgi:copper chaperone CopZ